MTTADPSPFAADMASRFGEVWNQMSLLRLGRSLPRLTVNLVSDSRFGVEIQQAGEHHLIVRLTSGTCARLKAAVLDSQTQIEQAVTHRQEELGLGRLDQAALLESVLSMARTFVITHELCHVLCGHTATTPNFTAIEPGGVISPADVATRYIAELEADGTALELMIDRMGFGDLAYTGTTGGGEAECGGTSIATLEGADRILAFRCLTTAAWVVIALLESEHESLGRAVGAYPLPSARLHAAVHTLLASYADLVAIDPAPVEGAPVTSATESDARLVGEFLRDVLTPCALWLDDVPTVELGSRLLSGGSTVEPGAAALAFVQDVGFMVMQETVATEGARELEALQAMRASAAVAFAAHSYL